MFLDIRSKNFNRSWIVYDSSFVQEILVPDFVIQTPQGYAIIKAYLDRNLDAAYNFIIFLRQIASNNGVNSIDPWLKDQKNHNPLFKEIEEDINKYLMLM